MASLADGTSEILNPLTSRDTVATVRACEALGAEVRKEERKWVVKGSSTLTTPDDVINVENSGTTIRIMTAVSALAPGFTVLTGDASVRRRPMMPLLDALRQIGVECWSTKGDGTPPIVVKGGGVRGGRATMRGDVSSQFISAILIVSPMAKEDTVVLLTSELKSKPYVDMTREVMKYFGVNVECLKNGFLIEAGQRYQPRRFNVPGDFSSAAFILAAAAVTGSNVTVSNLSMDTLQGDRKIIDVLREMGCQVKVGDGWVRVEGSGMLRGVKVDCGDTPDLLPVISVVGAVAEGETVLFNAEHARFKESDRIHAMSRELSKMGVKVKETKDGLIVEGGRLKGGIVDAHGDHRVFMALAVAGLVADGETVVVGEESVDVSYPEFIEDMVKLGANFRRV